MIRYSPPIRCCTARLGRSDLPLLRRRAARTASRCGAPTARRPAPACSPISSPGPCSSFPSPPSARGDTVLLFADDRRARPRPWISDGSSARDGAAVGHPSPVLRIAQPLRGSVPPIGNAFVFAATDGAHGSSSGRATGPRPGRRCYRTSAGTCSSTPENLHRLGRAPLLHCQRQRTWARAVGDAARSHRLFAELSGSAHAVADAASHAAADLDSGRVLPTLHRRRYRRAARRRYCYAPGDAADLRVPQRRSASGEPGDQVEIDVRFRTGGLAGGRRSARSSRRPILPFRRSEGWKTDCAVPIPRATRTIPSSAIHS